jgi:predicted nucleic acid-binding protein
MKDRILLDKNIILDIIDNIHRSSIVLNSFLVNFEELYISSNTFLTIFYLARKLGKNKDEILSDLSRFSILAVDENHCLNAANLAKNSDDVEDSCELILAKANKLHFITADKALFESYKSAFSKIILVE